MTKDKRMVEMFAGVGGFRVAFENLASGWTTVWANQWEPGKTKQYAYDCYLSHWGDKANIVNKDISTIDKKTVPDMELLVGGFPCQDYSVAHSGARGIQGKKGVLWWDVYGMIKDKHPKFVLLENVDRLLSSPGKKQRGRDFGIILYTLNMLGYGVQWRAINAADYGFPQKRRRVFIFAYANDTNYYKSINKDNLKDTIINNSAYNELPISDTLEDEYTGSIITKNPLLKEDFADVVDFSNNFSMLFQKTGIMHEGTVYTAKYTPAYKGILSTLNDIVEDSVDDNTLFLESKPGRSKKMEYLKSSKRIPRVDKNGYKYTYSEGAMPFPDPLDRPGRTMLTSEHSVNRSTHAVKDKKTGELRFLSPLECERLNMFPDNWTENIPSSARYFTMGNALVVGVVQAIGKTIDKIMDNE